jgi:alpha-L-rhamnosidase
VQDANVTAILAGMPSPARARGILTVLQRALRSPFGPLDVSSPAPSGYTQDISPYMGSFNVLADFAAGAAPAALSLIRQEWGYMVSHDPGGVDWERIQLDGIPAGGALADSSAHAWSTGPTAAMSQYLLGVAPAAPGYRSWTVAPRPGELRWAQGAVPTPHGEIAARWRRTRSRSFVLTVQAPRGASGLVEVPLLGRQRVIARNGRIVWSGGRPVGRVRARRIGNAVAFAQGAGGSTYAWGA